MTSLSHAHQTQEREAMLPASVPTEPLPRLGPDEEQVSTPAYPLAAGLESSGLARCPLSPTPSCVVSQTRRPPSSSAKGRGGAARQIRPLHRPRNTLMSLPVQRKLRFLITRLCLSCPLLTVVINLFFKCFRHRPQVDVWAPDGQAGVRTRGCFLLVFPSALLIQLIPHLQHLEGEKGGSQLHGRTAGAPCSSRDISGQRSKSWLQVRARERVRQNLGCSEKATTVSETGRNFRCLGHTA